MSFPRFHLQPVHAPHLPAPSGLSQHLHVPALLGALTGCAFAAAGLLTNGAYFTSWTSPSLPARAQVVQAVTSYINQWQPQADPLMTVAGVGQVKSSNVDGVEIEGRRYYYRMVGAASFDPVSQGAAERYTTVAVLDPGTEWEVQIYHLD